MTYVNGESQDQSVHLRNRIRTFTSRRQILLYPMMYLGMKGPESAGSPGPSFPLYVITALFSACALIVLERFHKKRGLRGMCEQRRPRSDCAYAQSDLGLRCPLIRTLDTVEYTYLLIVNILIRLCDVASTICIYPLDSFFHVAAH